MVERCDRFWLEVSNYIDNEVDPSLRAELDAHLQECPSCRSVLEGTRNVIQLYGDERLFQVPLGFSGRLRRKLVRPQPVWQTPGFGWVFAAAALVLVVGTVAVAKSPQSSSTLRSQLAAPAKRIPPQLQVVVAEHGKLFHLASCSYIHAEGGSVRSLTAEEAAHEGYAPCVRCLKDYVINLAANFLRKHGMG